MGMKLVDEPLQQIERRRMFEFDDDFTSFATATGKWQTLVTGSGVPAVSQALPGGVLVNANSGGPNDAIYIASANPVFLWQNSTPVCAEFLFQYAEASVNNANLCFGLWSTVSATLLANGSGGTPSTGTGALIWKQGGQLTWQTLSSLGTTQNKNATNYVAGSQNYTRLRVQCEIVQGVYEITYFIDQSPGFLSFDNSPFQEGGGQMHSNQPFVNNLTKDYIPLSGGTPLPMYLVFGIKNGTTTGETLNVDYAAAWAGRGTYLGTR